MSETDYMPEVCPECAALKHDNCDGTTWNDRTDAPDVCPCYMAGHGEENDARSRQVLAEVHPDRKVAGRIYTRSGRASA